MAPGHRRTARDVEWTAFTGALGDALGCLERGHVLVVGERDEGGYTVQLAADGAGGFRAEAVSNRSLEGWRRLDPTAEGRLRRLGWRPPTDIGAGPEHWWRDHPLGLPPVELATVVVATLRKVYEIGPPSRLAYRASGGRHEEILLPTLGLERQHRSLVERVEAVLRDILDTDTLVCDEDGDWPIRRDDLAVFVRVDEAKDYVAVFSPALRDVARSTRVFEEVNRFNTEIRLARATFHADMVFVSAEVDDQPRLDAALRHAYDAVSALASVCVAELRPTIGGRAYLDDTDDNVRPDEPSIGLYL